MIESLSSKQKSKKGLLTPKKNDVYFCTECFHIVNLKKDCVFWGDEIGLDSITHKKPCGDELNSDISVVKPFDMELLFEAAKERRDWYKRLFEEMGADCDYAIKKLGITLIDFRKLRRPDLYKKEALEAIEMKIGQRERADLIKIIDNYCDQIQYLEKEQSKSWGIGERKGVIPFKDTPFGSELIKAVTELKKREQDKTKGLDIGHCDECEELVLQTERKTDLLDEVLELLKGDEK